MNRITAALIFGLFIQINGVILAYLLFQKGLEMEPPLDGSGWCFGGVVLFFLSSILASIVFGLIAWGQDVTQSKTF